MQQTRITTEQLAAQIGGKAASIRTHYCERGSFHGLIPEKLPSGRLLWPADSVEHLLAIRQQHKREG